MCVEGDDDFDSGNESSDVELESEKNECHGEYPYQVIASGEILQYMAECVEEVGAFIQVIYIHLVIVIHSIQSTGHFTESSTGLNCLLRKTLMFMTYI